MAILFAFASMACAAISDITFKLYARENRSIGIYIACIGGVWVLIFGGIAWYQQAGDATTASLTWGAFSGLCGAVANITFIEAMKRRDVVTCATIYRLNLAPAALLAFVFLGEQLSWQKFIAILAAVCAVVLLWQDGRRATHTSSYPVWPVVAASILRALMGLAYKAGLNDGGSAMTMLAINGVVWITAGGGYYLLVPGRRGELWRAFSGLPIAFVSGLLCTGIVGFVMLALQRGDASIVLPTSQLSFVLTAALGVLWLKEAPTRRRVGSIAFGCACVVLMAAASYIKPIRAAEPAIASPAIQHVASAVVAEDALASIDDDPKLPRVLLIGDSISIGYTLPTRRRLSGIANVHRPPVNCTNSSNGLEHLDEWLGAKKWDVIHFNFGLHDLKFRDGSSSSDPAIAKPVASPEEYETNLRKLVSRLQNTGAKLIWASTTPVPAGAGGRAEAAEVRYNEVAAKVMEEHGISIDDLHQLVVDSKNVMQREKNVHFTGDGYEHLAASVAESIRAALPR